VHYKPEQEKEGYFQERAKNRIKAGSKRKKRNPLRKKKEESLVKKGWGEKRHLKGVRTTKGGEGGDMEQGD